MPRLVAKFPSGGTAEFELRPGLNRVGRHPENDLQVVDPSVSSFHCELQVSDIGIGVRDLDSTNGTFINQKQIKTGFLHSSDLLTLGAVLCTVDQEPVNIALPEMPVYEPQAAPFLDDGRPACYGHPLLEATLHCIKCENWYCAECVRTLKKINGELLFFCPECSGACVPFASATVKRRKSLLVRLQETLRLTRKK